MAEPLTLAQRIAQAETAYDDLVSGRAVRAFIDQNGERVEYVQANSGRLYSHIMSLKSQLATGGTAISRYRGPLRFTF